MAHGPVNKAWFVRLTDKLIYKIHENQYNEIRENHPELVVSVLISDRTDRTVHFDKNAVDNLLADGYELKENGVYGKLSKQTFDFSA